MKLVAIELENFQAFKEPVRIEFSPITLFFGPNSAGKSAVMDALDFLREFWNPANDPNEERLLQLIRSWTHKTAKDNLKSFRIAIEISSELSSPYYAISGSVGDIFRIAKRPFLKFMKDPDDIPLEDSLPDQFRYELVVGRIEWPISPGNVWSMISLNIQSITTRDNGDKSFAPLVDIQRPASVEALKGTKFDENPYLRLNKGRLDEKDKEYLKRCWFIRLHKSFLAPDLSDSSLQIIPLQEDEGQTEGDHFNFQNKYLFGLADSYYGLSPYGYWDPESNRTDWSVHVTFHQAITQMLHYLGAHVHEAIKYTAEKVLADRTIPPKADLLFPVDGVCVGEKSPTSFERYYDFDLIPEKFPKAHPYRLLAEWSHSEFIHRLYQKNKSGLQLELDAEKFRKQITESAARENFCEVNRYLSDFLFKERGYQVSTLSTFLLAGVEIADGSVGAEDFLSNPALVRIRLKDSSGSTREIEEVGSGIGFVLPVLIAILSNKISQIQQPELHLHPALQSELADILIDRLNNNSTKEVGDAQCIVETHSEHLLLRLLRRIRDTGKGIETALKANPSDVAVYYFNPSITGTTEIRKMLITPMGDFYNTWPRGFFDERSKDLFE